MRIDHYLVSGVPTNAVGPGLGGQAGRLRHAPTQTTLGYSPSEYDTMGVNISEYIFGIGMENLDGPMDDHKAKLLAWIDHHGAEVRPDLADGFFESIRTIHGLMQHVNEVKSNIRVHEASYQKQRHQIEKVMELKKGKLGPNHPNLQEVDVWGTSKLTAARTLLSEQEGVLETAEATVLSSVTEMIQEMKGSHSKSTDDMECDELMRELEEQFSQVSVSDTDSMNAATLALSHVEKLPNGPEKTALLAVLQVASLQAHTDETTELM